MRAPWSAPLKRRFGRALLLVLILTATAAVFWYRRLGDDPLAEAPLEIPDNDRAAQMVTRDFRHVETKMDRTVWVLEAKKAEVFEDSARLHAVKVTWYGEEEGPMSVVVTSKTGRLNFRTRNAVLSGAVRVVRADGALLETDELYWHDAKKLLRTRGAVVITNAGFSIRGNRMLASVKEQWVQLVGQVRSEIKPGPREIRVLGREGHREES